MSIELLNSPKNSNKTFFCRLGILFLVFASTLAVAHSKNKLHAHHRVRAKNTKNRFAHRRGSTRAVTLQTKRHHYASVSMLPKPDIQAAVSDMTSVHSSQDHQLNTGSFSQELTTLHRQAPGLSEPVLELALRAYHHAETQGYAHRPVLTVIDYAKPSTEDRMYVFNMNQDRLQLHTLVAHGVGSGGVYAERFSNLSGSRESSIGVFVTGQTYVGHKGYSLNLIGLEPGINNHAIERRVVIHGADYVSPQFVKAHGYLGRSFGCPAVATSVAPHLIDTIKNGSVVFAYYPNSSYLHHSHFVAA